VTSHLLSMADLDAGALSAILDLAERADAPRLLEGRGAALVFEHPSARTRNATEMAVVQLGGHPITIRGEEVGLDVRESVADVARTLAAYHALIAARVARHEVLERMVAALGGPGATVPVVNLLSDHEHPTQAVADLLTIRQVRGSIAGATVAFIGDGNNVARSLAFGCALSGAHFVIASPEGYELSDADCARAAELGGEVVRRRDPFEAAQGADVLYTDVWVSMGEDAERNERRAAFSGYVIDDALVTVASPEVTVLHCLPAHRGEEITEAVLEGPRSRVWLQAENRMHAARAVMWWLLEAVA
jgi:ornithine carbamoyltransferase